LEDIQGRYETWRENARGDIYNAVASWTYERFPDWRMYDMREWAFWRAVTGPNRGEAVSDLAFLMNAMVQQNLESGPVALLAGDLAPSAILMPNGEPIGSQLGRNPAIRTVQTESQMWRIFDDLTQNAAPYSPASPYPGEMYSVGGGTVGYRYSAGFGLTLDVNIPGVPIRRIHLPF
jgi:hypothetical protein